MIEFQKIVGLPKDVDPGEERVWYTDSGLTYVADNAGHPTRFGAGYHQGSTVPVGKPPAAGILYFCTGNGEYYLSNLTEWIVLNTETKTGGGGNAGYAGGVFITDLGNYYTSNEVEGALQEVGAAFPHLMGSRTLQPINTNLFAFDTAGERRVNANVQNSPTPLTSWLNQRQGSDGKTYGMMIAENGDAWTRHGDNFTQLASYGDLQDAIEEMGGEIGGAIGDIKGIKVRSGLGVSVSGSGLLSNSPVISLKTNEIAQMLDSYSAFPFVRNTGDEMTGDLSIESNTPSVYLRAEIAGRSTLDTVRFFNSSISGYAGLRDDSGNRSFLNYRKSDGSIDLNTGPTSSGVVLNGRLTVNRPNGQSDRGIVVNTGKGHYIGAFANDIGQISLLSQANANYIESDDNTPQHKPRDLIISSRYVKNLNNFKVLANDARFSNRVIAGGGMFLGMDEDHYGRLDFNNKLYLFPYEYNTSQSAATARKYYSHIGYSQRSSTLYMRSFVKNLAVSASAYKEVALNVSGSKFLTRSSEKYKEDIELFDQDALSIVEGTSAWSYKLKADESHRTNVGFILERGVPEFAIEDDGNSIDSYAMIAVLWKAVQELNQKVKELS